MPWDEIHDEKGSTGGGQGRRPDGPQMEIPKIKIPQFKPSSFAGITILLLLVWLLPSIFFTVGPDEEGVVTRYGKYVRSESPGLHVKFPSPIEHVSTPKVSIVRRAEIGFRIIDQGPPQKLRNVPAESLMLTGDQNIIDIHLVVQYQIRNAPNYLFNIQEKQKVVRNVAETVLRGIVGSKKIDEALTTGKNEIQILTKQNIQALLDKYEAGIQVVTTQLQDVHPPSQVAAAFKDVVSAREDKERMINEAQGYRKAVIPEARGKSAQIVRQAEGYREEKIKRAQGDAEGFLAQYEEYRKAPDITRKRLYLETMEDILPRMNKFLMGTKGSGVLPILPLGQGQIPGVTNQPK
ncbi:MAG: FtsH protease activity modulator HflK [Nitrospinota bacterium]|nr:FtsH protease activity modulator HflK [Nitrospinota bacterium]